MSITTPGALIGKTIKDVRRDKHLIDYICLIDADGNAILSFSINDAWDADGNRFYIPHTSMPGAHWCKVINTFCTDPDYCTKYPKFPCAAHNRAMMKNMGPEPSFLITTDAGDNKIKRRCNYGKHNCPPFATEPCTVDHCRAHDDDNKIHMKSGDTVTIRRCTIHYGYCPSKDTCTDGICFKEWMINGKLTATPTEPSNWVDRIAMRIHRWMNYR